MYTDAIVGAVRDRMIAEGTWDESIFVVIADHGMAFEKGLPFRGVVGQEIGPDLAADVMWVPFFLKEAGQRTGVIDDRNVLTVDLLPTIADLLDVDLPFEVDGQSTLGPPRPSDDKPLVASVVDPSRLHRIREPTSFDGAAVWRRVLARSMGTFLGPADDPERLWRIGPRPELVGQRIDAIEGVELRPVAADLPIGDEITPFVVVDVPGLEPGTPIAISLGGTVVATTPAFRGTNGVLVAAMFDDAALRAGAGPLESRGRRPAGLTCGPVTAW